MNYTEQISLEQALDLQNRINAGEMPDIHCYVLDYKGGASNPNHLSTWILGAVYDVNKHSIYLTRSDYATFIIGNKPVPEGYGYASMELDSGIYDSLGGLVYTNFKSWVAGSNFQSDGTDLWHDYAFLLTDLARVEQQKPEVKTTPPIDEKVEINLNQAKWLKEKKQRFTYWINGAIYPDCLFIEADIYNIKGGDKYEILTSTYNALPQEFKELEERKNINLDQVKWIENNELPIQIHYCGYDGIKIPLSQFDKLPKEFYDLAPYNEPPIPPSGIKPPVIDWEAKYKELERATTSTLNTSHGQRSFNDYVNGYCKQLDLADRVADLEAKLNAELIANNDTWIKANNELLDRLRDAQNCIKEQEQTIKEKDGNLISLMKAYEVTRSATLNLHCAQLDLTELLTRLDLNHQ